MRLIALALTAFLTACAGSSYNPTVFPYQSTPVADAKPIKNVVIANHNLGKPSRSYLEKHEDKVDTKVVDYLKDNGYNVLPGERYATAYDAAVQKHGNPYDYSTGRVDPNNQQKVLFEVFVNLREAGDVDAIVYTDIMERQVTFTVGVKHVARWDGVNRGPRMQGPGQGVPIDFNWAKLVDAASLAVYVFDISGQRIFHSVGGMSLTESIDTKGTPKFKRSRTVMHSADQIEEGVELAFHPFIPMKGYPGKPAQ